MSHPSIRPHLGEPNYIQLRKHLIGLRLNAPTAEYADGMDDAIKALDRMWHAACLVADAQGERYRRACEDLDAIEWLDGDLE